MSTDDAPPFPTIGIVGVGLIGGSIALAVRERWPSTHVVGVDRPPVLARALGRDAIDRAAAHVAELGPVDLIILAAPVRQNLRLLGDLSRLALGSTLVTDVGGTKHDIVQAARTVGMRSVFVGGHPISGAEQGGFAFARPDLFTGRPWILTPDEHAPPAVMAQLNELARGVGAKPVTMEAGAHDRAMAFVSHLPQLAASALMDVVGQAVQADGLRLAGRGLLDTTRLASSPASVWRDICGTNAEAVGDALDALIAHLVDLRADLPRGEGLEQIFDSAGRWRTELIKDKE
jgi:prephenate dehydrogenase